MYGFVFFVLLVSLDLQVACKGDGGPERKLGNDEIHPGEPVDRTCESDSYSASVACSGEEEPDHACSGEEEPDQFASGKEADGLLTRPELPSLMASLNSVDDIAGVSEVPSQSSDDIAGVYESGVYEVPSQSSEDIAGVSEVPSQSSEDIAGVSEVPSQSSGDIAGVTEVPSQSSATVDVAGVSPDVSVNNRSTNEKLDNEIVVPGDNIGVQSTPSELEAMNNGSVTLHEDEGDSGGEFKCKFHWHDNEYRHLKVKVLDWMKERQKTFNRFTVPVMGYNSDLPVYGSNFTGVLTWVWLSNRQKYMIHFPHNFVVISTATMGVITQDWALDYDKSAVPPSLTLSEHSIDIDDGIYEYEHGLGNCNPECLSANHSCGIGKHEMVQLLTNISNSNKFEWDWLCLQLNYDDVHSTTQTGSRPNFVMPDVLYYFMFLRKLFTERPLLGLPTSKSQFLHYHCYSKENLANTKSRELLEKYFVVPIILAVILWLYCPLLIHYFPSSSREVEHMTPDFQCPQGMFRTHKTPVYFGHCLKKLFCFYVEGNSVLIRLRRGIFLAVLFLSAFRVFFSPVWMYFTGAAILLSAATLYPAHLSSYITNVQDSNKNFAVLGWELTPGLIRVNPALKEYQLLASMMQERVYLILDIKFWKLLYKKSFDDIAQSTGAWKCVSILHGILCLATALIVYFVYYSTPLPFFIVEISFAILKSRPQRWNIISIVHRLMVFTMFAYSVGVAYFWCYAITEFSIFTLFGGVMSPSIIFPYFVLVGSFVGAIYSLIHSLHEHYNEILKAIIDILKSEEKITSTLAIEKSVDQNIPSINTVSVTPSSQRKVDLLRQTVPITYMSRDLYNYVVEETSPVCRYIFFIAIQIIAMIVYAVIALSTKNVFHLEEKVGVIFQLVSVFAVAFVPGLLRFLAYKSHFGKKKDEVLKKRVYFAMVDYFSQL